jgi:hypothetical protein
LTHSFFYLCSVSGIYLSFTFWSPTVLMQALTNTMFSSWRRVQVFRRCSSYYTPLQKGFTCLTFLHSAELVPRWGFNFFSSTPLFAWHFTSYHCLQTMLYTLSRLWANNVTVREALGIHKVRKPEADAEQPVSACFRTLSWAKIMPDLLVTRYWHDFKLFWTLLVCAPFVPFTWSVSPI